MPYLFLFLGLLLASPIAAAGDSIACPTSKGLTSLTDSLIKQGKDGKWGLYGLTTRTRNYDSVNSANRYEIDDTRKTLRKRDMVIVNAGITAEQATLALHHPDSLTSATTVSKYDGWQFWLTEKKSATGIAYHGDEQKTVQRQTNELESKVSWKLALCLFLISLFSVLCALDLSKNTRFRNSKHLIFASLYCLAVMAVLVSEAVALFQTPAITWPRKLLLVNLGASFLFMVLIAFSFKDQLKILVKPKLKFEIKGAVREWVLPLGIFTIAELVIYAGMITNSSFALLGYAGVAVAFFLIFAGLPAGIDGFKNWRSKKKPVKTAQPPQQPPRKQ
ncbi:MAG: hypothetical protein PHE24_00255 [Patescibacteria group bacterium]|nr:hypothetical protein [Patescibacteria group bacterium]